MTPEELRAEREKQRKMLFDKVQSANETRKLEEQMLKYKRIFSDYNQSQLIRAEFAPTKDENRTMVTQNMYSINNTHLKEGEGDQPQTIITADNQEIPTRNFFLSLDETRIIDMFGNVLGHDGYIRDKTNNIISNYKEKTFTT